MNDRRNFTVNQSRVMAKTLREIIHTFGLSKEQLVSLSKEFYITESSVKVMEAELLKALNDGKELDWSKKRR